jgi:uncharacterized membrane protein YfcA
MLISVFFLVAIVAGVVTTFAGQGGGILLVLALARFIGSHSALAVSTPALFLGNVHRAYICRRDIDRRLTLLVSCGVVPGAYLGGHIAGMVSAAVLRWARIGITVLAIAKALKFLRVDISRRYFLPAGAGIGMFAGTSGGAGVLLGPLLHAGGLRGSAYVGTLAAVSMALHASRVAAYREAGLLGCHDAALSLALAAGIFVGNSAADRARGRLAAAKAQRLEVWLLVTCAALSIVSGR